MNLSKEGAEALERLRTGEYAIDTAFDDAGIVVHEMMNRLYPVRTLNGLVIRWDDPVTPERLIASGFYFEDFHGDGSSLSYKYHAMIGGKSVYISVGAFKRFVEPCPVQEYRVTCGDFRVEWNSDYRRIDNLHQPASMGDVWRLMEKCGCPVKGDGE